MTNSQLPDDLYSRIATLGYFSCPHKAIPAQSEAKTRLHDVLTRGDIEDLPDALRRHGYAWVKDIRGRYIEGENWVSDNAYQLAREIDLLLSSSRQKAA